MKPETLQAMRWWIDGKPLQVKVGNTWEFVRPANMSGGLYKRSPFFSDEFEYRLKPRTIMIGDMEVPAPETEVPARGTKYYTPHITTGYKEAHGTSIWGGTPLDESRLEHGLVHLSWQNAGAHTKALIEITESAL